VTIGDHAVIGAGALICGGVIIGAGAIVGMGAVVLRDVGCGEMVAGNPAHRIGERERHYPGTAVEHWAPVDREARCEECERYQVQQWAEWVKGLRPQPQPQRDPEHPMYTDGAAAPPVAR
jgi:carbonic anhydrase/acetyltransferase-like protein (isoleucine patch superfamily)